MSSKSDDTEVFDEKNEVVSEPSDRPPTDAEKRDAWSMLSSVDPVTGLKYSWLDAREVLVNEGVAKALPLLFDYYMEENPNMDPMINYHFACHHFSQEEMGLPANKSAKRRLELRIRKLLKKKNPTDSMKKFYGDNADVLLNDN